MASATQRPASVVVVTGATSGLGLHCVRSLFQRADDEAPDYVVLACRNTAAANTVADQLAAELNVERARLVVLAEPCNLPDLAGVRAYAAALRRWLATPSDDGGRAKELVALVNNAGISAQMTLTHTKDGHELILATNHLGHFLLTVLLLPLVTRRIVNVSSEVHDPASSSLSPDITKDWPATDEAYERVIARGAPASGGGDGSGYTQGKDRYAISKLCNVFFTYELARRLNGAAPFALPDASRRAFDALPDARSVALPHATDLKVLAFNPGLMLETNFSRNAGFVSTVVHWLVPLLRLLPAIRRMTRSAAQSGANLADLALGAVEPDTSAAYICDRAATASSVFSLSPDGVQAQLKIWQHSVRWTGLTADELRAAGLQ